MPPPTPPLHYPIPLYQGHQCACKTTTATELMKQKSTNPVLRRLLCMMVGASIVTTSMAATTREVNQNDPYAPYQTVGAAVTDALPGDTILVHPGTYLERVTISGITLKSLKGPEVTVIQSPDGTGDGVTLTGNQNVTLQGFRVQGYVRGIVVNASAGATKVGNCIATGNSADGLYLGLDMPLSAKIVNNITADNGGAGLMVAQRGPNIQFSSVFNNIAYRNGSYGFEVDVDYGNWNDTFGDYNCAYGNTKGAFSHGSTAGAHGITTDPLVNATAHYRFNSQSSPCVNTGNPSSFYSDPDGSRCDMGAYGSPDAANWWRDPFTGPAVLNVTIDPPQVRPGSNIVIRATARTE